MKFTKRVGRWWWLVLPSCIWLVHVGFILFVLPPTVIQEKDERFFYPVAQSFRDLPATLSFEFLRHYKALQPPLVFWVGGLVLQVWNSLTALRLFNATAILGTLLLFAAALRATAPDRPGLQFLAFCLFAANPYLHLVGVYFYTDALYLFFVALVLCRAARRSRDPVYYGALFCCPLVRQFGVIYPVGNALVELIRLPRAPGSALRHLLASVVSLSGILFFVVLWQKLSPPSGAFAFIDQMREQYGWLYPHVLAYHIAALGFYAAPLLIVAPNREFRSWGFVRGGVAAALIYLAWPAQTNEASLLITGSHTLGLYHRAARAVLGPVFSHFLFGLTAFLMGGSLLILTQRVRWLYLLWIGLFLVISLTFQAWDKYLLDVLMVVLLSAVEYTAASAGERGA